MTAVLATNLLAEGATLPKIRVFAEIVVEHHNFSEAVKAVDNALPRVITIHGATFAQLSVTSQVSAAMIDDED